MQDCFFHVRVSEVKYIPPKVFPKVMFSADWPRESFPHNLTDPLLEIAQHLNDLSESHRL